ncbi:MAG: GTP-binding protein [Candidatus Aenigmarchaeota archaeon]|nr:GTP-binding protein [Candidatus Aenigmarchaeota archaeon]
MGTADKIKAIEEEMARTQYNKATQKHIGLLKAQLARLKEAQEGAGGGGAGLGYGVKKTGDATVVFVGFPSVGKSTLLNALTNATSRVAAYDFTTLVVVPGVMSYRGAKLQLLDVPGLIEAAAAGKGRGKEVLSVVRSADLILLIVAGERAPDQQRILQGELQQAGFRLNLRPPDVRILRSSMGGIHLHLPRGFALSQETVKEVLKEFRILNAEVVIRQPLSLDQLIDCLSANRKYVPCITVVNKADQPAPPVPGALRISALQKEGLDALREAIWKGLGLARIYLKEPGKAPSPDPYILKGKAAVRDVAQRFGFLKTFAFAKIWGPSARFPGQKVGLEHAMRDGDTVEIHA